MPNFFTAVLIFAGLFSSLVSRPPQKIPDYLYNDFTFSGKIPVLEWYIDETNPPTVSFCKDQLDHEIRAITQKKTAQNGITDQWLYTVFKKYPIYGKEVAIIGSTSPWYEGMVLAYGGEPTTIHYHQIATDDSRLKTTTYQEWEQTQKKFDLILSISSTEHHGLGRYGDPVNPNGDLEFMEMARKKLLKKTGKMILAVPVGQDALIWNAHRIYGRLRLPMLLKNWTIVDAFGFNASGFERNLGDQSYQPVFYLSPEPSCKNGFIEGSIIGQLGNKMFIVATTSALAWDHKAEAFFPELKIARPGGTGNHEKDLNHLFFRCNTSSPPRLVSSQFTDLSLKFSKIPFQKDMKILGYFQSEKHFAHHRKKILKLFAPSTEDKAYIEKKYQWLINHPQTVSIHIRKYHEDPTGKIHIQYGKNYISEAIKKFPKEALFVVFSNDIQFAKQNIPDEIKDRVRWITDEPHYIDLFLMSYCKHNIISNSSFSWWSAWLNQNRNKIVVAPEIWFHPDCRINYADIVPEKWIKVRARYSGVNNPHEYL